MAKSSVSVRRIDQKEEVIPVEEHLGLCTTCDNMTDCVFYKANGKSVQQCEEYTMHAGSAAASPEAAPEVQDATPIEYEYKGLCMNCEKRTACHLAKSEGGIWHCEEYV